MKTATCRGLTEYGLLCGVTLPVDEMIRVESPSKGYFFVCERCSCKTFSYTQDNSTFAHKTKKHGYTYSQELETLTSRYSEESNLLYQYGYLPTLDSTVEVEWKSPIWQSLCGLQKMFRTIEGVIDTNNSECGCHTNIGHPDMNVYFIQSYFIDLFKPLSDHLIDNYYTCKRIFGRAINEGWAQAINEYSYAGDHCNFINLQHTNSNYIEFRLPRFVNAEQYMECFRMCNEMTKCIMNLFMVTENEDDITQKKQAVKCGKKLVKIFEKYANR